MIYQRLGDQRGRLSPGNIQCVQNMDYLKQDGDWNHMIAVYTSNFWQEHAKNMVRTRVSVGFLDSFHEESLVLTQTVPQFAPRKAFMPIATALCQAAMTWPSGKITDFKG